MLPITRGPNDVLSQQSRTIAHIDKAILKLIEEMKQTLTSTHDPEGVGLAAPQVGKSLQLFIAKPGARSKEQIFINPRIMSEQPIKEHQKTNLTQPPTRTIEEKGKDTERLEGCLSLPNIWGEVKRSPTVEVAYQDQTGAKHQKKFSGFIATIIQHEVDHLNGILFPKRVLEQKGKLYKSYKDKKGKDVFEEIEL